ncbi:DUF72 domain-containing protein [bacterium AH-315-F03]|nr:DUF72 domain-containing protein [bacterium AH-315-F03]
MEIRIGTSGFSFADWKGAFYPEKMQPKDFFGYYTNQFRTVEINSTYYGIPRPQVSENLVKKAPEGFDFMVKAHASFTHERESAGEKRAQYLDAIRPYTESGKLAGILAQFPHSFKFTQANLDYVLSGCDYFPDHKLFVEFRHESWYKRPPYYAIRDGGLIWVSVDLPELANLPKPYALAEHNTFYLRLHGRNKEKWYGGGDGRYDYNYSEEELQIWKKQLAKLEKLCKAKRAYIFFNNCYRGQAVRNAKQMIEMFHL